MSDKQGALCCILHAVGAIVAIVGIATGHYAYAMAGMGVYGVFGALTIKYIAE